MPKAKTAKKETATAPSTYSAIPLSQIVVSPFEPQARRRARYVPSEILEIAESIRINSQLQPIKVRPVKVDGIEIKVDGENRFEIVATLIICAWGQHGQFLGRSAEVLKLIDGPLHYLRMGKVEPWHPLYLPGNLTPVEWHINEK